MSKESWYKGKPKDIVRIDYSDDFVVDYDKERGMYRVSVFEDNHFWDEFWFDAYEEREVSVKDDLVVNNKVYIVNGYINESGDEDTWIEELFEDEKQANACCEYLNITNTQKNVTFYLSESDGFCKEDYVSKLEDILRPDVKIDGRNGV